MRKIESELEIATEHAFARPPMSRSRSLRVLCDLIRRLNPLTHLAHGIIRQRNAIAAALQQYGLERVSAQIHTYD